MRHAVVTAALAALLAAAPAARAESPRWGSFSLRGQTYRPNVDAEFGGSGPYETIFGTGRGWVFRGDFARTVWDSKGFGALEVSLGTGYFSDTGRAVLEDTTTPSVADETTFRVVPLTLSVGYRFDWLSRRFEVPVMLYGKASLERLNWWVADHRGVTVETGATNGYSFTGGVGFLLDFLDPGLAREMERDTGVNDTWLVFDVTKSVVDDFGSGTSWDLSDESISLGFGLMFAF
ncbi:MAG TPA: MXAN_2562 family outer membrane beta-barrel protein [Anaeromyxobacteraceae bacterium]|nr:MXAN_2562 family outer membrane beta-barrel protein [Anaeromyxobacteraceae bacterium]